MENVMIKNQNDQSYSKKNENIANCEITLVEFRKRASLEMGYRDKLVEYRKSLPNSWDYNAYVGILLGVGGPKHGDAACRNYAIGQGDNGNNTKRVLEARGLMNLYEKYKGKKIDEMTRLSDVEDEIVGIVPEYNAIRQKFHEITMGGVDELYMKKVSKFGIGYEMYCDFFGKHSLIYRIKSLLDPNDIVTVNNKSYCIAAKYDSKSGMFRSDDVNLITVDVEGKIEEYNCFQPFKYGDKLMYMNLPLSQQRFLTVCGNKIYQVRFTNDDEYFLVAVDLEKKNYTIVEKLSTAAMHFFQNKYGDRILWTLKFVDNDEEYHLLNLNTGTKKIFDEILAYNDKYIYFRRKDRYYYTDYSLENVVNFTSVFKGCDNSKIYYIDAKRDIVYFYENDDICSSKQLRLYGYHISGNNTCIIESPIIDEIGACRSTYFDGESLYIVEGCIDMEHKRQPGIYKYDFNGNCINQFPFSSNICGEVGCSSMIMMAGKIYGFVKDKQTDEVWFASTEGDKLIRHS